ncbi:MAG TPA: DNA-binding protein [Chitinophagaceae bacterium]|nr:DNA-binding protein [Chitinophagaceae bacterium]
MEVKPEKIENIQNLIFSIRGTQVMIDFHLADMYGVTTKRLNEQVKRNSRRFPESFMFQLNPEEWSALQTQIATIKRSSDLRSQFATAKRRTLPFVFSEQGVAMLASVLYSEIAIEASILIMQAFVNMRKFLLQNASVFQRIDKLEYQQQQTGLQLEQIFKALDASQPKPEKGIFFEGQIFDAYVFVSELIKKAEKEILIIDNYIDETILVLLSKRKKGVKAHLFTKTIGKTLQLDAAKHNEQYPGLILKPFAKCHDRFLLIDGVELYHIGASLKDLGKKWFAFSRMDSMAQQLTSRLIHS